MVTSWVVLVISVLQVVFSHPIYNVTPFTTTETPEKPRVVVVSNLGNYSLSFVPLISILASIIPRVFNRFKNIQTTQTVASRGASEIGYETIEEIILKQFNEESPCLNYQLGRWSLPGRSNMFYQCQLKRNPATFCYDKVATDHQSSIFLDPRTVSKEHKTTEIDECLVMRIHTCKKGYEFNNEEKLCKKILVQTS